MEKYKTEILFFTIISIVLLLFPPVTFGGYDNGYAFLLSIGRFNKIDYFKLLLELILLGLVTVLYHYCRNIFKRYVKRNNGTNHFVKKLLLGITLLSILFLFYNYYENLIKLYKPSPLSTLPIKYSEEINYINNNPSGLYTYGYSDYNAFKKIIRDRDLLNNYILPKTVRPDITPYLSDYHPKNKKTILVERGLSIGILQTNQLKGKLFNMV